FTAPADGTYLIRVSDARGFQGELYAYQLRIHEARPDFKVTLEGTNPTIGHGSGQGFTVKADRIDGFEGDIRVDITGWPPGFTGTTPLVIQAGHSEADGSLFAAADAAAPSAEVAGKIQVAATAILGGKKVIKPVNNFGQIKVGPKPKLLIALEPDANASTKMAAAKSSGPLWEITIAPGQTVPAWLRVVRGDGQTNLVNLDVDNLPQGVIIDNIGLNGVQIRAGENEREIFFNAAKWVPETDRLCHAILNSARTGNGSAGKQTSLPILLKVRKPSANVTASAR
ncbi:MAG: hypothetical protein HYZ36_02250, partial [Pedosphaera parvula]|nr:hypothetical protein [Pedosphaera parvula]